MKSSYLIILFLILLLAACQPALSAQVPLAELPDPAIYTLTIAELPEVGLVWQHTNMQDSIEQGYKWSYQAFQAYQPGNLGVELESGFAVNNDVVLYEADVSRQDLPQPPQAIGDIHGIEWKVAVQPHRIGDKSAVWKTTLGELMTPAWWLAFYQGHAYVRISLLGFPDQIAPAILFGLADVIASRIPRSVEQLRADSATPAPSKPSPIPSMPLPATPTQTSLPTSAVVTPNLTASILPGTYSAPPGETGKIAYLDETGQQLADGIFGMDDILTDQGQGTAFEWVGWTDATEPVTLTFNFEGEMAFRTVEIGFNHREGLGIFVPELVTINEVNFVTGADDVPNNQRKNLSFTGPFNGPVVQVILHHRGRGWILVDEVLFIP